MKKETNYIEANRIAWNEVAPIHAKQTLDELLTHFQQPGYSCLDLVETQCLAKLNLEGKAVAQLCCNNGRELLSIKNNGAGYCVGFDIANNFIVQAEQLKHAGNIDCEFLCTDVYDIPERYSNQFDLVYISIGAICWLPDLPKFFAVVTRLLKPKGYLFLYDMHPILSMFDENDQKDPPTLAYSYFNKQANICETGLDYYGNEKYVSAPMYWFHHKLSDIIKACLIHHFNIKEFMEYEHDICNVFGHFQKRKAQLPLCYTLLAQL